MEISRRAFEVLERRNLDQRFIVLLYQKKCFAVSFVFFRPRKLPINNFVSFLHHTLSVWVHERKPSNVNDEASFFYQDTIVGVRLDRSFSLVNKTIYLNNKKKEESI
jgi:hypothetical protein